MGVMVIVKLASKAGRRFVFVGVMDLVALASKVASLFSGCGEFSVELASKADSLFSGCGEFSVELASKADSLFSGCGEFSVELASMADSAARRKRSSYQEYPVLPHSIMCNVLVFNLHTMIPPPTPLPLFIHSIPAAKLPMWRPELHLHVQPVCTGKAY